MDAREILEAAAEDMAERGWTRGKGIDPASGAVCLWGSLLTAQGYAEKTSVGWKINSLVANREVWNATVEARDLLESTLGDQTVVWNDHVCPDQETAILALKKAAAGETL